jgi:outer membrane protein OmpA-like peptidoglycan-associated protein
MKKIILSLCFAIFAISASAKEITIHGMAYGSGTQDVAITSADETYPGSGLYSVQSYMPGYPTAGVIYPRVIDVKCVEEANGKVDCDGYNWSPSMGRGEYLLVHPIITKFSMPAMEPAKPVMPTLSINFDTDKAIIKAEYIERIKAQAEFLKANPSVIVTLEGNTDVRRDQAYNLVLGYKRANAARDYLISMGVAEAQVKVVSFGKDRQKVTCSNDVCLQANRRVDFVSK